MWTVQLWNAFMCLRTVTRSELLCTRQWSCIYRREFLGKQERLCCVAAIHSFSLWGVRSLWRNVMLRFVWQFCVQSCTVIGFWNSASDWSRFVDNSLSSFGLWFLLMILIENFIYKGEVFEHCYSWPKMLKAPLWVFRLSTWNSNDKRSIPITVCTMPPGP